VDKTQRLMGIALAVLALEGCRGGAQTVQRPGTTPSPRAFSAGHVSGGGFGGGFWGRVRGAFGEAGAHGAGG
jgi:hypothetical protein